MRRPTLAIKCLFLASFLGIWAAGCQPGEVGKDNLLQVESSHSELSVGSVTLMVIAGVPGLLVVASPQHEASAASASTANALNDPVSIQALGASSFAQTAHKTLCLFLGAASREPVRWHFPTPRSNYGVHAP